MSTAQMHLPIIREPSLSRSVNAIEVDNLSVSYKSKHALKTVSLHIPEGKITALIGASGCGKTSFLSCLNRTTELVPGAQIEGKIVIGKQDILSERVNLIALRRQVGMIFQQPNPFPMSVGKNITFPLRENGVKNVEERHEIMERVLRDVGLWEEVKHRLKTSALSLSGGQKQRLCIARALALEPSILLLDEPCSALDPLSSGRVEDLIKHLKEKYTVVIVTHNLHQARRIADQVAFFWVQDGSGTLVEHGSVEKIFNNAENELTMNYICGARG